MTGHLDYAPTSHIDATVPITPVELEQNSYATAARKQPPNEPTQKQPAMTKAEEDKGLYEYANYTGAPSITRVERASAEMFKELYAKQIKQE